jgi:group I intron endonuclease
MENFKYTKEELNRTGVYKISNLINGNVYIGSTFRSFKIRWNEHIRLFKYKKNQKYLQHAWDKYGRENFIFEILEFVENDKILEREQWYLDNIFSKKYNILPTAGSTYGQKLSDETKLKISNSHIGIKPTEEVRKMLSDIKIGVLNNRYGVKHTECTKLKMSKNAGKSCSGKFGKLHHNSKKIIQKNDLGEIIKMFDCMKDVERELGYSRTNISKCCNRHIEKAYGYKWDFVF